jgi:23S rRNA (adenine2503-C2)-methyltransferase
MGMGEPLLNLDNVAGAITILTDDLGLSLSHRKITVSTAGMANKLQEFSQKIEANLAVSLNATTDASRSRLMPINQKYDLNRLMTELAAFPLAARKRITFEYIMLDGINDQKEDAWRLIKLLHGLRFKINLIPYNGYPGSPYKSSSEEKISQFQKILLDKNINTIVRHSRGQDILAACGQLALNKTA